LKNGFHYNENRFLHSIFPSTRLNKFFTLKHFFVKIEIKANGFGSYYSKDDGHEAYKIPYFIISVDVLIRLCGLCGRRICC